jgi:hypothetical protein
VRGDGLSVNDGRVFKLGLLGNSGSDWKIAQGAWKILMLPHRVGLNTFTTGDAQVGRYFSLAITPLVLCLYA